MDEKRGIGLNDKIPWRIPEDMKHFQDATVGNPVIMGRVTWDSLPERFRPLPDRRNIIITRSSGLVVPEGVYVENSLEDAIAVAHMEHSDITKISIMGGAQIYAQALRYADKLDLTQVQGDFNCDTFFPDFSGFSGNYKLTPKDGSWLESSKGFKYRFLEIEKI